jgi:nucleoside-diphosphate-sugar epimerase
MTTAAPHTTCRPLPAADLDRVLESTRGLWDEARGRSLFITGGPGFFGHWLLESFAHANEALGLRARAVVLTRDPAAFARKAPYLAARPGLEFVQGDVRDFAFPPGRFPLVIHAATAASAKLNDEAPLEMFDTIVAGTRRVVDFAAQGGVEKLLLTSSGAVYGRQPSDMTHVPEDHMGAPDPLLPASAYGEGKRAAEHLCAVHALRHGYEAKIARGFAFVGPHLPLDAHFAIGNFIRDALAGGPIRIAGDGSPFRSYLYASDLAVWLWTILLRGAAGRAYNVGSAHDIPIAQVAAQVSAACGGPEVRVGRAGVPGQAPSRYVPDVGRAERELGLRESVPLAEAVRRTAAWLAP